MKPEKLLQEAKRLNREAEKNIFSLGFVLLEILETKAFEIECASFHDFCIEELGRSKGFVSKLLISATFLKTHGHTSFPQGNLTITKLYQAIQAFPDKKPEYILAAATENTRKELEEASRERKKGVHDCEPDLNVCLRPCISCGKLIRV